MISEELHIRERQLLPRDHGSQYVICLMSVEGHAWGILLTALLQQITILYSKPVEESSALFHHFKKSLS